ncbi:MAG: extracellular solute-binding protein [Alphaproteobacteria bacterium]|nr:extracellular solute-binding protein [Alphaproteobacteria bacterium]
MMTKSCTSVIAAAVLCLWGFGDLRPVAAAELPAATVKMLAKLKLSPDILKGLDQELKIPAAWVAGAKKEGPLKLGGTWDAEQFENMVKPLLERYPFIKIKYARATSYDRVVKPLMAFRAGRVITDVISGVGSKFNLFKKYDAAMDLRIVPNWKNVPDGMKHPQGLWVGQRLRYWCMAYNTNNVAKKDLPRTWEDLYANKRWHGKKIGLGNRPNLWLLPLMGLKGEAWTKDFTRKLFGTIKPQLRKEGMNALIALVVAGEFDASLPSAAYRTAQRVAKGAPVAWHCPVPIPLAISEMLIVKGTKKVNTALIYVNWFLSKEGQISQFSANKAPPVHRDLQTNNFLSFPDQIVGKETAFRHPELMERDLPKLMKFWDPMWFGGRGLTLTTVRAKITKIKRGGRRVSFKVGGKTHTVKVSGSRTAITVKGAESDRKGVKPGMTCDITYPGNKEEAKKIACM